MSDVLTYICDYLKNEDYMLLYVYVIYQITQIFDMGATFILRLINVIKKNKSFEMEL